MNHMIIPPTAYTVVQIQPLPLTNSTQGDTGEASVANLTHLFQLLSSKTNGLPIFLMALSLSAENTSTVNVFTEPSVFAIN